MSGGRTSHFAALRGMVSLWAMVALLLAAAPPALATTGTVYTVSGFSDSSSGSCNSQNVCPSLRLAVLAADSHTPATVQLSAGTYVLTQGELYVNAGAGSGSGYNLTITGAGAGETIIAQQTPDNRVIDFAGYGPYLVSDLEVTGGNAVSTDVGGATGGGIYGGQNDVDLDHVLLLDNSATGSTGANGTSSSAGQQGGDALGGGLYEDDSSPVLITDSTFQSNTATGGEGGAPGSGSAGNEEAGAGGGGYGGGMAIKAAIVDGSTFYSNRAVGGQGASAPSGPDTAGEGGQSEGGGIETSDAMTLEIINSTVTGNSSTPGAGGVKTGGSSASTGPSDGGGISSYVQNNLYLFSDTIVGNAAQGSASLAGNVYTYGYGSAVWTFEDTIVADGTAATNDNCQLDSGGGGSITDDGHNLESDSAQQCHFNGSVDLLGEEPDLNSLADNGGPTETMLPQAGSPVIRAGGSCTYLDDTTLESLITDQRGDDRSGSCDIGAVQVQPAEPVGKPTVTGTPDVGDTVTCDTTGAFTGDDLTYRYYWYRNGTKLLGFYNSTYVITAPDAGQQMTCIAIATGATGATEYASSAYVVPPGAGTISWVKEKHYPIIKGKFKLTLVCKGGRYGCRGAVSVFTPSLGKNFPYIGSTGYSVNSGKRKTLTFKVPKKLLGALRRHHGHLKGVIQFYLQDTPGPLHKVSIT